MFKGREVIAEIVNTNFVEKKKKKKEKKRKGKNNFRNRCIALVLLRL